MKQVSVRRIKLLIWGLAAGKNGGYLIAEGTVAEIKKNKKSLTGSYLSKRKKHSPLYEPI